VHDTRGISAMQVEEQRNGGEKGEAEGEWKSESGKEFDDKDANGNSE